MSAAQEWQGYVQSVDDYTFTAVLTDITHGSDPDAIAVFRKSSLTQSELGQLEENVYLRWTLTPDADHPDRMNSKISLLLDRWTAEDVAAAERTAADLISEIDWE